MQMKARAMLVGHLVILKGDQDMEPKLDYGDVDYGGYEGSRLLFPNSFL